MNEWSRQSPSGQGPPCAVTLALTTNQPRRQPLTSTPWIHPNLAAFADGWVSSTVAGLEVLRLVASPSWRSPLSSYVTVHTRRPWCTHDNNLYQQCSAAFCQDNHVTHYVTYDIISLLLAWFQKVKQLKHVYVREQSWFRKTVYGQTQTCFELFHEQLNTNSFGRVDNVVLNWLTKISRPRRLVNLWSYLVYLLIT